jgi:hypothetical protein
VDGPTPLSRLRRLQRWALRVAIVAALLGLATASGCAPGLDLPRGWLGLLHPLLLLVGGLAGWAASRRMGEIDRERWRVASDPDLTSGERQYAHREAEARRRRAAAALLGAPLLIGYCSSGQIEAARESLAAQLLGVTALAGGILGLIVRRRVAGRDDGR